MLLKKKPRNPFQIFTHPHTYYKRHSMTSNGQLWHNNQKLLKDNKNNMHTANKLIHHIVAQIRAT